MGTIARASDRAFGQPLVATVRHEAFALARRSITYQPSSDIGRKRECRDCDALQGHNDVDRTQDARAAVR